MNKSGEILFSLLQKFFKVTKLYKIVEITHVYDNGCLLKHKPKILILGSSFANTNIDPNIISQLNPEFEAQDIVNFGQSMGGPYEMYISSKKNIQNLTDLKYVYIGLDPHILGEKFYHYMFVEKLFVSLKQWKYFFQHHSSYMEQYHPNLSINSVSPIKFFFNFIYFSCRKKEKMYGYEPRYHRNVKPYKAETVPLYTYEPIDLFPVSKFQIHYLKAIKNLFKSKTNAKIVFFLSPSYDWQLGYCQLCTAYDEQLVKLLQKSMGDICLRGSLYKEDFDLRIYDFYDNRHLSYSGAVKYTNTLFNNLETTVFLTKKIEPLCKYRTVFYQNRSSLFIENLTVFKSILEDFLGNKRNVILYGLRNTTRCILSLYSDEKNIIFNLGDSSDCLRSFPEYLSDNFIYPKKIIPINKIIQHCADGFIVTNFVDYDREYALLMNHGINATDIFRQTSYDFNFHYFTLQVNMFYKIVEFLIERYESFTIIGESIIVKLILPILGRDHEVIQIARIEDIECKMRKYDVQKTAFIVLDSANYEAIKQYLIRLNIMEEDIVSVMV